MPRPPGVHGARGQRPLGAGAAVTALLITIMVLSAVAVGLSSHALILLTRRSEPPEVVMVPAPSSLDVDALTAALVLLVEAHATRVVTTALAAVDAADLVGIDEADVLRRLATWRDGLVAAGEWSEVAEAAARATLGRHKALNGGSP